MKIFGLFFASLTFLCCSISMAQDAPQTSEKPIEITASKNVEWQRNEKKYVAREDVIVTQGSMTIRADILTAYYRESEASSTEIYQMTAEGNVQISDEKNTAYADKAVYDVTASIATLTGQNLKLVSPDQTVTARDKMEYFSNEQKARAIGNAKVVRANDTLTADTITAYFKDSQNNAAKPNNETNPLGGGSGLDRLEAQGNVVIKTPNETLYGNNAVYTAQTDIAQLTGKVKVEQGKNTLEGNRAEVNLTTNISKMFGSSKDGGRVRGVFFPSSKDNKQPAAKPTPTPAQTTSSPPTIMTPAVTPPLAPAPPPVKVSPAIKY